MSPKLLYCINIIDIYTGDIHTYEVNGPVIHCVNKINEHYGCSFITKAGVCNVISRPSIVAERFKGLEVTRFQTPTKKYQNGDGGRHMSVDHSMRHRESVVE